MADFIGAMQKQAKNRFGKELSPSEVAAKFQEHDFEARIHHLDNLDTAQPSDLREAADLRAGFARYAPSSPKDRPMMPMFSDWCLLNGKRVDVATPMLAYPFSTEG
jgi:hypothetical protein